LINSTPTLPRCRVNDGLRRARPGSSNEATLLDERDRLISNVANATDIAIAYDGRGAATVRTVSGDVLLDGSTIGSVALSVAADGQLSFTLAPANAFTPSSGKLAGLTSAASHIAGQRATLDTLAARLASDINSAHQAGLDANGNPGVALLSFNGGAAAIAALALSPSDVAAANATSDNGNMLGFATVRAGGIEEATAAMIAAQAQGTAAARAQEAAASSRRDGAFAARDAIGAVDLDREAAELLRFQQAYEAAARTIQVARETMQSVLNIF
jgi:flagellar hook-associated protein 1